jgi:hypothetical protein
MAIRITARELRQGDARRERRRVEVTVLARLELTIRR